MPLPVTSNDGDIGGLAALGKPNCKTCSAFTKNIADAYEDGGYVKAAGWTAQQITRATKRQDMVFVVRVKQGRERFYTAEGKLVRRFDGSRRNLAFYLAKSQGSWLVSRLDLLHDASHPDDPFRNIGHCSWSSRGDVR